MRLLDDNQQWRDMQGGPLTPGSVSINDGILFLFHPCNLQFFTFIHVVEHPSVFLLLRK